MTDKNWCQGFCRLCGTGCAEYCDALTEKDERIKELEKNLKEFTKHGHPQTYSPSCVACLNGDSKV